MDTAQGQKMDSSQGQEMDTAQGQKMDTAQGQEMDSAQGQEDGHCTGTGDGHCLGTWGWMVPAHRRSRPSVCAAFKTSPEGKSPAGRIYMSRKGATHRAAALPFLDTGARVVGAAAVSAEAQVGCFPALSTEIWLI